jgi:16S rRNA (cytidine1402-2'-O)-methyltransferase
LQKVLGEDRKACVVREISKIYESYHHGSFSELQAYFTENKPKGEIVLIMEGKS